MTIRRHMSDEHRNNMDIQYPRFIMKRLKEALEDTPVVLIYGPRQCGKSTLAHMCSAESSQSYVYITFDDENQRQAATFDPVGFARELPDYVILDEVQRVPALFTAIKKSVDDHRQPGRFLLTGSSNLLLLPSLSDSLAGRMEVIHLRPLSQLEVANTESDLIPSLLRGEFHPQNQPSQFEPLGSQVAKVMVCGGYPAAMLRTSPHRQQKWYQNYIQAIVQRDIQDLFEIQHANVIPQLLEAAATQTGHLYNLTDLASPFSVSRTTIGGYIQLLERIFLIDHLPSWHSNRLSRLIKSPKIHLADPGLVCALLQLDAETLWNDKCFLGQVLETFVYQEIRKQASWLDIPPRFYHFRNKDKVEVDIVIESGRAILGVEIKAAATVIGKDFNGLKKLQDALGSTFKGGIVFYDGDTAITFGHQLWALPLRLLIPEGSHS